MTKQERVYIRVTEAQKERLQEMALKENRSLSNFILTVVENHINKEEIRMKEKLEMYNLMGEYSTIEVDHMFLNNCGNAVVVIGTSEQGNVCELWWDNLSKINLHEPTRAYDELGNPILIWEEVEI